MQQLSQTQLNEDIAIIQLLHSRLGLDLAKCMSFGTGNFMYIKILNYKNILISDYLEILQKHDIKGDSGVTDLYNIITVSDVESIVDDCYRELERYNT
jgi:hypothetical protein